MYRVSPFTYLISGMLSTGVANTNVKCAVNEFLHFPPPNGQTCGQYMSSYIASSGGYLQDPDSITNCSFCSVSDTNIFLASLGSYYSQAWRNYGIMWAYILFNIAGAVLLYWLIRVPKDVKKKEKKEK